MSRLTDDELFKELNRTERSMQARDESLKKLQQRIGQKRGSIFPVFLSGVLTAATVILLTFILFDSNLQQTLNQGKSINSMEQRVFEGSSGDWSVEYEVTEGSIGGEQNESIRYVFTFQGYDFPKKVNYEIRLPDGTVQSGSDVPVETGNIIRGTETCECNFSSGEEPIEVSVSWNGMTETFDLREKVLKPLPLAGTGESWSFSYEPGAFGDKDKVVLNYIGEGQPPSMIDYEFDGIIGGFSSTGHLLDEGQLIKRGEIQNLEIYQENQGVEISIDWEGQSESFTAFPNEFLVEENVQ